MSMKALRKALKDKKVDKFETGTVIRFTRSEKYTYGVIKAGNGQWYSTSAAFNTYVPQIMSFDDLIDVLSSSEVSEIEVSSAWEALNQ